LGLRDQEVGVYGLGHYPLASIQFTHHLQDLPYRAKQHLRRSSGLPQQPKEAADCHLAEEAADCQSSNKEAINQQWPKMTG